MNLHSWIRATVALGTYVVVCSTAHAQVEVRPTPNPQNANCDYPSGTQVSGGFVYYFCDDETVLPVPHAFVASANSPQAPLFLQVFEANLVRARDLPVSGYIDLNNAQIKSLSGNFSGTLVATYPAHMSLVYDDRPIPSVPCPTTWECRLLMSVSHAFR